MMNIFIKLAKSFLYAFRGIAYTVKTQRNMRLHITAAGVVLWLSGFYGFSEAEYALVILTISFVIVCEIINTSVEAAVDMISQDKSRLAKIAKDTAAGAVLISALASVCVAVFLFWDTEVFNEIIIYFNSEPVRYLIPVLYVFLAAIFIFGTKDKKD